MIYSPELPWAVSLVAPPSTLRGNALLIRQTNTHLGWDLQFSTGFIKGPKRDSGWLMELKSTAIFGGIINLPLAGTCCEGLGKIPPQLLGSCSMSIAINRLIDSLNLMPVEHTLPRLSVHEGPPHPCPQRGTGAPGCPARGHQPAWGLEEYNHVLSPWSHRAEAIHQTQK